MGQPTGGVAVNTNGVRVGIARTLNFSNSTATASGGTVNITPSGSGSGTDTNAIANLNGQGTNTTLRFPTLLSVSNIVAVNSAQATVIASNIGVMPIAAGGSGDFVDLAATAPKFAKQLAIAANGTIGVANSTTTGDWNAQDKTLQFPFRMTFGDQNGQSSSHLFGKNGAWDFWANASAYNQLNDTGRNDTQADDNVLSIGNANSRKYGAIAFWRKELTNLTSGWANSGAIGIGNVHSAAPYQFFYWEMNRAADRLGGLSIQSTEVTGAPSWTYLLTNAITGVVTTNTSTSHYYQIMDNAGRLVIPYNRTGANDPFGRTNYFVKFDPLKNPSSADPNVVFSNASVKIFPGGSFETPGIVDLSAPSAVAQVQIGSSTGTRNSASIASGHFYSIEAAGNSAAHQLSLFGGGGLWGETDLLGIGITGSGTFTTNIYVSRTATDAAKGGVGLVSSLRVNPTGPVFAGAGTNFQVDTPGRNNALSVNTNGDTSISGTLTTAATTNTSLTANTFAVADANKKVVSTGNSAALAATLTDETGTGLAMFDTSPTFNGALTYDSTPSTGISVQTFREGAGQQSAIAGTGGERMQSILSFRKNDNSEFASLFSNAGSISWWLVNDNVFRIFSASGLQVGPRATSSSYALLNSVGLTVANNEFVKWSSTTSAGGSADTGLYRNAAGVVEVNNGSAGTLRDITVRALSTSTTATIGTSASIGTKITSYNGDTLFSSGQGVPTIVDIKQISNGSGAVASTNSLFTPVSNGVYRASIYLTVTTAATSGNYTARVRWKDFNAANNLSPSITANAGAAGFAQGTVFMVATNGTAMVLEHYTDSLVGNPTTRIDCFLERLQ